MTGRLKAKFTPAFSRDLKKKAVKRKWNLAELETVSTSSWPTMSSLWMYSWPLNGNVATARHQQAYS